ncbi:DDB1- and CUL4-associated factor 1-like [Glandiceps talaboti]
MSAGDAEASASVNAHDDHDVEGNDADLQNTEKIVNELLNTDYVVNNVQEGTQNENVSTNADSCHGDVRGRRPVGRRGRMPRRVKVGGKDEETRTQKDPDVIANSLTSLSEILEKHSEAFLCSQNNPFQEIDENDESNMQSLYYDPDQIVGIVEKLQTGQFQKFLGTCLQSENTNMITAACRLLIHLAPQQLNDLTSSSFLFFTEEYLKQYVDWIKEGKEPLKSYATAVLALCNTVSTAFDEQLNILPDLIKWLRLLKEKPVENRQQTERKEIACPPLKRKRQTPDTTNDEDVTIPVDVKYVQGSYCLHPVTDFVRQISILQFLQRIMTISKTNDSEVHALTTLDLMDIILHYVDIKNTQNILLTREGLKFALLELKTIPSYPANFVSSGGIQKLVYLPISSMARAPLINLLEVITNCNKAISQVLQLPKDVITEFVSYCWRLYRHTDLRKCMSILCRLLEFPVMLEVFDQMFGLDFVLNMLEAKDPPPEVAVSHEHQVILCLTITKTRITYIMPVLDSYYRSCALMKAAEIAGETSKKPKMLPKGAFIESVHFLAAVGISSRSWKLVDILIQGPYVQCLFKVISEPRERTFMPFEHALSVLLVVTTTPEGQLKLCDSYETAEGGLMLSMGFRILLNAIMTTYQTKVKILCLRVLYNCLCHTLLVENYPQLQSRNRQSNEQKKHLRKMQDNVQLAGAVNVLVNLLTIETPRNEADQIRSLVIQCLYGLALKPEVAQIIGKLPLITDGELKELTRIPISDERKDEHRMFCRFATKLIDKVTYKEEKKRVKAAAEINYSETELMHLIHDHLLSKGLSETARILNCETEIPKTPLLRKESWSSSVPFGLLRSKTVPAISSAVPSLKPQLSTRNVQMNKSPLKRKLSVRKTLSRRTSTITSGSSYQLDMATLRRQVSQISTTTAPSLDSIVKQYLRNQHVKCTNPVAVCPTFKLRRVHSCPDSAKQIHKAASINNIISRTTRKQVGGLPDEGCTRQQDRHFKYSRFYPVKTCQDPSVAFSSCQFLKHPMQNDLLACGDDNGQLHFYDIFGDKEIKSTSLDSSVPIKLIKQSMSGKLVITSGQTGSKLWTMGKNYSMKLKRQFDDIVTMSFSNLADDKMVGVNYKDDTARVYNTKTGKQVVRLYDAHRQNSCMAHFASFDPMDTMVLADGLLWDIRSATLVHKFDQFEDSVYTGLIHPSGLQFVINNKIWDARTFKLFKVVPDLEPCGFIMKFSHDGDTLISGTSPYLEKQKSSFIRTFDARTYQTIFTMDMNWKMQQLTIDAKDQKLAVLAESPLSCCRVYDIGRKRHTDEPETKEAKDDKEEEERRIILDMQSNAGIHNSAAREDGDSDDEEEGEGEGEEMAAAESD